MHLLPQTAEEQGAGGNGERRRITLKGVLKADLALLFFGKIKMQASIDINNANYIFF